MPDPRLLKSPLLRQVRFPWYVARELRRLATGYDVADCSSGDGWVYQAVRRENRLLMVARSHGLEHIVDSVFREEVASGKEKQSWKYPLYHGGYRLWEVARSFRTADLSVFPNRGDREFTLEHLEVKAENPPSSPTAYPMSLSACPCGVRIEPVKHCELQSWKVTSSKNQCRTPGAKPGSSRQPGASNRFSGHGGRWDHCSLRLLARVSRQNQGLPRTLIRRCPAFWQTTMCPALS